ncbi:MAG: polysaccharide deacetylase family protein [Gammaproteobacteria bacterium]|nr:polysaccharide deacetylase family protein [Gammaproteobacteria bacterium]MDH5691594.1 polysaccharide deacetylase family protein [Gammaproteobacteria bacterium]
MLDQSIVNICGLTQRVLSLPGSKRRLSILIYHRVMDSADPYRPGEANRESFRWQMKLLARNHNVLPLSSAIELLLNKRLPSNAVSITFDDGYADNHDNALPILKEFGLCATFFIASGFLNGGRMWNDDIIDAISNVSGDSLEIAEHGIGKLSTSSPTERMNSISHVLSKIKYIPHKEREQFSRSLLCSYVPNAKSPMMNDDQVVNLRKEKMEIGGHTVSHPILAKLTADESYREIKEGKDYLEDLLGESLHTFAYPNGKNKSDYNPESLEAVKKAGFKAAVTTDWGVSSKETGLFQLKRFTPWDNTPSRFALRLAKNYFGA